VYCSFSNSTALRANKERNEVQEWYEQHFQEDYLKIYKHRSEIEAARELEKLAPYLHLKPGQKALDLCCGEGRHSRWLAKQGLDVLGIDLSPVLLQEAMKKTVDPSIHYIRSDVRHIAIKQEMDLVVNLFTSFGYFETDRENEKVIQNVSSALKEDGYFLIDYLNPDYVKTNLIPFSRDFRDGLDIVQYRTVTENFVRKKIIVNHKASESHYSENVKLYSVEQLMKMLVRNDLHVLHLFGDYNASAYQPNRSLRMILICKKEGQVPSAKKSSWK
jgi:SAM-dependent methyltransferase